MKETDLEKLSKIKLYQIVLYENTKSIYQVFCKNLLTGSNTGYDTFLTKSEDKGRPFVIMDSEHGLISEFGLKNMKIEKFHEIIEQACCLEEILSAAEKNITLGILTGTHIFHCSKQPKIFYPDTKINTYTETIAIPAQFVQIIETAKYSDL